jgi:SAM-dependent methyltransferase
VSLPVDLPHSEACERNKSPILAVLREVFAGATLVVEIGSGTGQHAVHFARHLPWLRWQPTDRLDQLAGLDARVRAEGPPNLALPVVLDVMQPPWPALAADAVFSANTLHILSWPGVEAFFAGLPSVLEPGGVLAVYGPFRAGGQFDAQSNAAFDRMLRERDPASGLRDLEAVDALAAATGLERIAHHPLPANNRLVAWRRRLRG